MLVAVEDVTVTSLVYHIITAPCLLVLLIGVKHDTTGTQIGRDRQTDRQTDKRLDLAVWLQSTDKRSVCYCF